jgi:hypothetical protein
MILITDNDRENHHTAFPHGYYRGFSVVPDLIRDPFAVSYLLAIDSGSRYACPDIMTPSLLETLLSEESVLC